MSIGYLVDYDFWTTINGIFTGKLQAMEFKCQTSLYFKSEILKANVRNSYWQQQTPLGLGGMELLSLGRFHEALQSSEERYVFLWELNAVIYQH